jgi:two-component sensor histidine kinase
MNMASPLSPPCVTVPIRGLPIPAAILDRATVIAAANDRFAKLCGLPPATCSGQRFVDMVAESDRPVVEGALNGLALLEERVTRPCRITVLRAKPPSVRLAIEIAKLGPESEAPYFACLRAIPPKQTAGGPSVLRNIKPSPPLMMTLSHEVHGPLMAIRGWARMATLGTLPPEAISRALTVIGRNAESLSCLIENLFDLSRRAAGSLAVRRDAIDLNPLAQLVVASARPAARARGVIVTLRRAHDDRLVVMGDPFRLKQVVMNLVDNALKFTPSGGHVQVHTGSDGLFAELVVTDNGLGIAPDVLPAIFEPFRHDDATARPSQRGLGLGLALVRELVQLHGGDVRALSAGKGQGSTFIVRLPRAASSVAA